jgi:riboflavin synthase
MRETLECSNLGLLKVGDEVNVERSMQMNGRLDGHIVQGHVDQTATCLAVEDQEGSHQYTFRYKSSREMISHGYFTVDKGSVTVNGVSLTVCRPTEDTFQVCIIPYTFENTNFHNIKPGSVVNIEFDIIGKYLARMNNLLS